MNYNYLRYFSVLAQVEHYTLAAARLGISQPSLSAAIHHLEEELGDVALFEKVGRNIRLTDEGRYFREKVDAALQELNTASMTLRDSKLGDEEARTQLCQKIIESVHMDENYLILLACDSYDVPFKSKDDSFQKDNSDETYTYILCTICPVKQTKANLHYVPEEKLFHDGAINHMVSAPILGFLFPAFDNRSTNIYNALYYTKNIKESGEVLLR